jgi:hypothetical protein
MEKKGCAVRICMFANAITYGCLCHYDLRLGVAWWEARQPCMAGHSTNREDHARWTKTDFEIDLT